MKAKKSLIFPRTANDSLSCQKGISITPNRNPSNSRTFLKIPSGKEGWSEKGDGRTKMTSNEDIFKNSIFRNKNHADLDLVFDSLRKAISKSLDSTVSLSQLRDKVFLLVFKLLLVDLPTGIPLSQNIQSRITTMGHTLVASTPRSDNKPADKKDNANNNSNPE
jgi:hypothetical protein